MNKPSKIKSWMKYSRMSKISQKVIFHGNGLKIIKIGREAKVFIMRDFRCSNRGINYQSSRLSSYNLCS